MFNENEKLKTIVINVMYEKESLNHVKDISDFSADQLEQFNVLLQQAYMHLQENGFVYVYGNPNVVSYLVGNYLETNDSLSFKYWIAINSNEDTTEYQNKLMKNHIAAIMLIRSDSTILDFDTESCRTNRFACPSCRRNSKDWGGKKHLLNIKGVAISDVWNDLVQINEVFEDKDVVGLNLFLSNNEPLVTFDGCTIPPIVLNRLLTLTKSNFDYKQIDIDWFIDGKRCKENKFINKKILIDDSDMNCVICGDSIEAMEELCNKYPDGMFDLIFADPPYNLSKNYKNYDDENSDFEYEEWCNRWLLLCYKLLKPNGHLLVLNLPKWTLKHISFLIKNGASLMDCIVWDAMSTPLGKVMPAHYSLVHFCKDPNVQEIYNTEYIYPTVNYCLRPSCIKNRTEDNSRRFKLSNIWSDAHRIKHKKDRDDHPCQLPEKLMTRIIKLFSNEGDLVFDPFCGAGTTAISALLNGRNYYTIDISNDYVEIARKKLEEIKENGYFEKKVEKKEKRKVSKKKMELYTQNVLSKLRKKPTDEEFISILLSDESAGFTITDIEETYGNVHSLIKKCSFVIRK